MGHARTKQSKNIKKNSSTYVKRAILYYSKISTKATFLYFSLSLSRSLSIVLNAVGLYFKFTCRQRERERERERERQRQRERDYYVKWKQKCSFLIDKDDDYLVSEEKCIEKDQNRVKDKKTNHPSLCFVFLSRRSTSNPFSTPPINQQT